MKIIIILVLIIYFINSIHSITVNFNNTLTNQCNNQSLPCDLSSSQYWDNPISAGDDLIIDLTTSNNKNNPYFLIINNNINIQINSLTLKGQLLSKTSTSSNLNIDFNGIELNITTVFNVSTSNVNITSSAKINANTFNTSKSIVQLYDQASLVYESSILNGGNLNLFDESLLVGNQLSNFNTLVKHTSSTPITLSGYTTITGGSIYSTGQVSILTSQGNTSLIINQLKSNPFNISSLVVSGSLLFKGDGTNWRFDDNIISVGNITTLDDSALIIIDTSVFTLYGSINGANVLDGKYFQIDYSSVTIPSGFTIQGQFISKYTINSILIIEGFDPTTIVNANLPYIDVDSDESSFLFINSTVGEVGTTASWVNVTTSSVFENILCVSCNLYIAESQTLYSQDYVQVSESVIVNGTLILGNEASFEAGSVSIPQGGKLFVNGEVKVDTPIVASSLELTNSSTVYSAINITENGYLTIDSKDITLKKSLTLLANTTLEINNYYLYNNNSEDSGSMMPYLVDAKNHDHDKLPYGGSAAYNDPIISVSDSVLFDSVNIIISFQEPTSLYNNISIVLLKLVQNSTSSYQLNINNMAKPSIQLVNIVNIQDITPKINFVKQDNTLRLEFDHINNYSNTSSPKWKVAFIVCVIVGGIFGIALVLVLVLKMRFNRFNGEYQRLINSSKA